MTELQRIAKLEQEVKSIMNSLKPSNAPKVATNPNQPFRPSPQRPKPQQPQPQSPISNINSVAKDNGKKRYGFRPDLPDQRDFRFESLQLKPTLHTSIDLRATCSPVKDQGQLGSCTANAFASAIEFLENKDKMTPDIYMSRLFIYYNERALEGTTRSDSGASLRDGIKSLVSQGCCPETEWPYIVSRFEIKPPNSCYTDGAKHIIQSYYRVITLNDMKTCLASGFPFVFGFTVYESFESNQVALTGIVPMPAHNEQVLGGHACMVVGYDDTTQRFLVKNSWGTSWGMKGYFTIPYAYLTNPNLASDMWYISKAKGF
jgi:C1A family cysteine protease